MWWTRGAIDYDILIEPLVIDQCESDVKVNAQVNVEVNDIV